MLTALRDWYFALPDTVRGSIRYEESPPDRPKRSAWIVIEAPAAMGQVTIWDSGECDIEAEATLDGEILVQESRVIATAADVTKAAEDLLSLVKSRE